MRTMHEGTQEEGSPMIETCTRCGGEKRDLGESEPLICTDCKAATIYLRIPLGSEEKVLAWLERVIDRRVQKALTERRLP